MQFTRLKLNGFKSFVDPTDLVISTGLTGVVGPNGCGKSNLLEALRWIMGENRAKQMRGDGMEDVIFAGTEARATRSSATVELVIDNSDRLAPAQFNYDDKLEISRRITRDVGSAYKINGKDVRARDVQMLFADASTGAHSPALVRQGQISELINAKPKARRRVLEEAAGISGLYQRRHEAELKLNAAENNIARVQDTIDQLRQQLGSLERQAGQARRYRKISEDLRRTQAVLLYLRWRVADAACAEADSELTAATRAAAQAEATGQAATRAREAATEAIAPKREEETIAAAVVQRLTIERHQIAERVEGAEKELAGLTDTLRQLAMDVEWQETSQRDAGAKIAELSEEADALAKSQEGEAEALEAAAVAARNAGQALTEQETKLDRLTEEAARIAARTSAAERRIDEARSAVARLEQEIATTEATRASLSEEMTSAETRFAAAGAAAAEAQLLATEAEAKLADAESKRTKAQEAEGAARATVSDAEGELSALQAEVQGLERLLARDAKDGAKLIDKLTVEPGYEIALGAALGEDLNADTVSADDETGWHVLPPYETSAELPAGVTPLSAHVKGPEVLTRRLAQTGLLVEGSGAGLQETLGPGQRVVSRYGAMWRWDGFHAAAGDLPTSAALRLQQRNRLVELQRSLKKAADLRQTAADAHEAAREALTSANATESATRAARGEADRQVGLTRRELGTAETALGLLSSRLEGQAEILASRCEERDGARENLAEAESALQDLEDVTEARKAVEHQRGEVDLARTAMLAARAQSDELRRTGIAREKRHAEVRRDLASWKERQENAAGRIADLRKRISETESRRAEISSEPARLRRRQSDLDGELETAERRRGAAAEALAEAETSLRAAEATEREAEREASGRREARARIEATREGLAERLEEATAEIRTELDLEPADLLEHLDADPDTLPPVDAAETEVAKLRRQRDALGSVNLRAEEDAEAVRGELEGIEAEKSDLEEAIGKLRKGIAELNREGRERLLAAFETVNKRFSSLFTHLFGGGEARLVMVESDDPLDAGLEILCQPPGKKLSTLSLLSGGEQTLTALSLIFAVFLSNPSPICVLDEVDAPLDDSNVTRFCDLLDEMRRLTETRFLIITHHALTMSRMDRLFGVTMVERGVSQLVSVDLARASQMVDA